MATLLRFPLVAATLVAGACVGVLLGLGQMPAAKATATIYALTVALYRAVSMLRELFRGRWGIDLLAVTAIVSTLVVGEYIASLIIVLMLTGGDALEEFAHGRASRELKNLLERAPRTAHRESPGNPLEEVPVGMIRVGDTLLVKPSEIIPVDGLLLSGGGIFDESSLTGESLPVEHREGDAVLSGAVNGEQAIRLAASATVADSQYSRIIALVQEAAASRAPTVRLADRYAVPFTIFAFLLAGMAWFSSQDPDRFAQVLVVATPCPLLIAAPVAFLAGTSRAAHSGIIIKNAGSLEQLARVRTAVFDKTGTLTHGRPTLRDVRVSRFAVPGMSPGLILQLAASAEQSSSHVLAASVIDAARSRGLPLLPVSSASEHATQGVTAVCGDHQTVVVGKADFVGTATTGFEKAVLASGQLGIYVGVDGHFAGALIMSDPLRGNALATLAQLRRLGVRETMLLTGDTQSTASHIAAEAGITRVVADCLPADKVAAVAELNDRPVMMVGDGVNDAPVLAAADVGIAMGAKGATAASESADVVIMLDDLSKVAVAVDIGRHTIHIARTSIWTGILLSVVLMTMAAYGFVPAVAGALLQELVDLATILNALRALGHRPMPGGAPSELATPIPAPKTGPRLRP